MDLKGAQLPTTLSSVLGFCLFCSGHLPWDIATTAGPHRVEAPIPSPSSILPTHPQGCICLPASAEGQRQQWNCSHKTGLQSELFQESETKKYQLSTKGLLMFLALKTISLFLLREEPLCWSFTRGAPPVRGHRDGTNPKSKQSTVYSNPPTISPQSLSLGSGP